MDCGAGGVVGDYSAESASLAWVGLSAIRPSVDWVTLCFGTVDWFPLWENLLATVPQADSDSEVVCGVIWGCSGVVPLQGHCLCRLVETLEQMHPTLEHE